MAKHLNFVERGVLYRLRMEGKGQAEIARVLGRHPSTICRELQRNTGGRGYRPQQAQRKADERRLQCRRPRKMDDPRVKAYVQRRFNWFWSPDQIAHRRSPTFREIRLTNFRTKPSTTGSSNRKTAESGSNVCDAVAAGWGRQNAGNSLRVCRSRDVRRLWTVADAMAIGKETPWWAKAGAAEC